MLQVNNKYFDHWKPKKGLFLSEFTFERYGETFNLV
jgi:hypothetical protein